MKYIRTKDKVGKVVYIVDGNTCTDIDGNVTTWTEYVVKYKHKKWNVRLSKQESESSRLSDNVEELCDEIVFKNKNSKKPYLLEDWQKQELYKQKVKPDFITEIYGAI